MRDELATFWESLKRFMSAAADLIILNFLVILCCVPVITAGAAWVACYGYLLRLIRDGEGALSFKLFWTEFAKAFRKATLTWLLIVLCFGILAGDFYFAVYVSNPANMFFLYFSIMMAVVLGLAVTWVFPLQARYENSMGGHMKNAFLVALATLPKTLLALAVQVLVIAAPFVMPDLAIYFGWLWVLFGFSLPMYITVKLYRKQLSSEPKAVDEDTETR